MVLFPEMVERARAYIRSASALVEFLTTLRADLSQLQVAHEKRLALWTELGIPEWVVYRPDDATCPQGPPPGEVPKLPEEVDTGTVDEDAWRGTFQDRRDAAEERARFHRAEAKKAKRQAGRTEDPAERERLEWLAAGHALSVAVHDTAAQFQAGAIHRQDPS